MAKKINYASMYTLRPDGRYQGYWHELDADGQPKGKRHTICDRDPEKLYRKIQEKESVHEKTFGDVAETWQKSYRETITERTWNNFRPHYETLLEKYGDKKISDITATDIIADLQRLKAYGYSRTVVNSRKVIINGILNQALADGDIPFNPAMSVRLPKGLKKGKRTAPEDDILRTICQSINKPFGFFVFLLLCTGMRKSEALALHIDDIDFQQKRIHVRRSLTYVDGANPQEKLPKNGKDRYIPIISALEEPLKSHCAAMRSDLLFPQPSSNRRSNAGGYYSERAYEGAWERYCIETGLVDENGRHTITAHSLRHATATLLFESDVDVYTAQQILGHSKVSTTMEIYTDLRKSKELQSVKKFNNALAKLIAES